MAGILDIDLMRREKAFMGWESNVATVLMENNTAAVAGSMRADGSVIAVFSRVDALNWFRET